MDERQKTILWFVANLIGVSSQVWLCRQIEQLQAFRIETIWWGYDKNPSWNVSASVNMIEGLPPSRRYPDGRQEGVISKWLQRALKLPHGNYYAADTAVKYQLKNLCKEKKPGVILCHYGHNGLALLPLAKKEKIPIAVHFHGDDISSALRNRWYRWSLRRHVPSFDAVICVGSKQREILKELGVRTERIHLIPCGAPVEKFRRHTPYSSNSPRFISACRLVPEKGVNFCIEAFSRISEEFPNASYIVIGSGPEEGRLKELAKSLGVYGRISFKGTLSSEEILKEMELGTAFLQHSLDLKGWSEGFGVSVSEASAMELPVIVSACGGLIDQVIDNETGFIVPQKDSGAMADAMRRTILERDLAESLGANGRKHVEAHFNTTSQIQKLEKVLSDLTVTCPPEVPSL